MVLDEQREPTSILNRAGESGDKSVTSARRSPLHTMNNKSLGLHEWSTLKVIMEAKVEEFYSGLNEAYQDANQTFAQRLADVDGRILKSILGDSQKLLQDNFALAQKQHAFCKSFIAKTDRVLLDAAAELQAPSMSAETAAYVANAEIALAAKTTAGTVPIVVDALCLCALLAGLLGHREAVAFVAGAKKELLGAVFDPGTNVLTLLKRLHAVATRTLRSDQDADALLQSLDMFQQLMKQWRVVMVNMSQGQPFAQAVVVAFNAIDLGTLE
jgi:hypothetical protein